MAILDPKTGVPIIGARDPQAEARAFIDNLRAEKSNLAPDDHDWVVLISYALSERDAERAAIAKQTGVAASPSIPVTVETMLEDIGPLCRRCQQLFIECQAAPCPGMPFEQYLASLPDDVRAKVIERLQAGDIPPGSQITAQDDGTITITNAPEVVVDPGAQE